MKNTKGKTQTLECGLPQKFPTYSVRAETTPVEDSNQSAHMRSLITAISEYILVTKDSKPFHANSQDSD